MISKKNPTNSKNIHNHRFRRVIRFALPVTISRQMNQIRNESKTYSNNYTFFFSFYEHETLIMWNIRNTYCDVTKVNHRKPVTQCLVVNVKLIS